VVAEHLLRKPGAALIAGPAPYAGRPAQLPGDVAECADQCAGLADPRPGRPLVIKLRIQAEGITGELLPRDLGYPELRMVRRARRVWPPLDDLSGGPVRLAGSAVAPLAGDTGRELSSLGVHIEWPENVARGLVARAVLVPRAAGAVSAQSTVAVRLGLWLDDAALTEQESAAVTQAEGLIRIRGQWVVIDPASRDRAHGAGLPAITGPRPPAPPSPGRSRSARTPSHARPRDASPGSSPAPASRTPVSRTPASRTSRSPYRG